MTDDTAGPGIPAPEGATDLIDTDYDIGQDNIEGSVGPFGFDIHNPVFMVSGIVVVLFVIFTALLPDLAESLFSAMFAAVTQGFDWFFLSAGNIFVLFSIVLILTPLGKVRLGGKDATPDYGYPGWFAMLFAAGMGIGLMFYGVGEPLTHYGTATGGPSYSVTYNGEMPEGEDAVPPGWDSRADFEAAMGLNAANPDALQASIDEIVPEDLRGDFAAGTVRSDWAPLDGGGGDAAEAERVAMAATIYHWGLHPWAIYSVLALALALFSYNKGLPLSVRSAFYPILGERVWGWWGHAIDIIAVFATLFGLATSLGLGSSQAAAGLTDLFGSGVAEEGTRQFLGMSFGNPPESGTENSNLLLVLLIAAITGLALISVVRGLDGGVKILSEINMGLALVLMLFVLLAGPTWNLLTGFVANLGAYGQYLLALSNPFGREDVNFTQGWTSFYWAWWISWSPFVGMFIARVSRGRTVREFITCVLLIPSLLCVFWMTVFGGTAIEQLQAGNTAAADATLPLQLFRMLDGLPLAAITSLIGIVLVIVFFVTSSDSGSLVIDTITAGGKVDAPVPQRVFWAIFEGAVAIVLLIAGGLAALQSMVISTGLIFAVVLLVMCYCIVKGLASEPR